VPDKRDSTRGSRAERKRAQRAAGTAGDTPTQPAAAQTRADAAVSVTTAPAPGPRWTRWLPAAVTALTVVFALRRLDDFDTWWHLASGRWIVEHTSVPHTDVFSHTVPTHVWINLQWLYDVLQYALYRLGGADLLVVSSAAAFAFSLWIVMRNAQLFVGPTVAAFLGLFSLLVAEERFMIRPEMATFILLGLTLNVLFTARRDEGARLWLLPVLTVVWVNLHSLFIIGLLAMACFGAAALAARARILPQAWRGASDPGPIATKRLLAYGALSLAVTVLNPYFVRGTVFPLVLMSRITGSGVFQAIGEFRPPFSGYFTTWSLGAFQAYFFVGIVLGLIAAVVSFMRPRSGISRAGAHGEEPGFNVGAALLFVALAFLSTLARRNMGLFVIGITPIVASWIALVAERLGFTEKLRGARAAESGAGGVLVAASVALAVYVMTNGYSLASGVTKEFGAGIFATNFPIRAAEFAAQTHLPPKLYNDLTSGGYLTWDAGVDGGVFIDGRLEVYDKEFFSEYSAGLNDLARWQRDADKFGVATVVLFHRWQNRHPLISFLAREPHWALVYYDEAAVMFVRRAGNEEAIARAVAEFPAWDAKTLASLASKPDVWGAPIERVTALDSYGRLMLTLGKNDRALDAWQRELELAAMPEGTEAIVRYRVAWLLANKGERANALRHAAIAAKLAPDDENIKRLIVRLGS
jgi:hypothetical protein